MYIITNDFSNIFYRKIQSTSKEIGKSKFLLNFNTIVLEFNTYLLY